MEPQNEYTEKINSYLMIIENESKLFEQKAEEIKQKAEKQLSEISENDSQAEEKRSKIKVDLKNELNQMIKEYENSLRNKFINNLEALEKIYNQIELFKIINLEKELTVAYQNAS